MDSMNHLCSDLAACGVRQTKTRRAGPMCVQATWLMSILVA